MFPWISTTCFNSKLTEEIFVIIALYTIVSVQGWQVNTSPLAGKETRACKSCKLSSVSTAPEKFLSVEPLPIWYFSKIKIPATNWAPCQQQLLRRGDLAAQPFAHQPNTAGKFLFVFSRQTIIDLIVFSIKSILYLCEPRHEPKDSESSPQRLRRSKWQSNLHW